ncbi:MAG: hypothetical protein WA463_16215 [Terriglobales bacterium]
MKTEQPPGFSAVSASAPTDPISIAEKRFGEDLWEARYTSKLTKNAVASAAAAAVRAREKIRTRNKLERIRRELKIRHELDEALDKEVFAWQEASAKCISEWFPKFVGLAPTGEQSAFQWAVERMGQVIEQEFRFALSTRLTALKREFRRDWALADDDQKRDLLTKTYNQERLAVHRKWVFSRWLSAVIVDEVSDDGLTMEWRDFQLPDWFVPHLVEAGSIALGDTERRPDLFASLAVGIARRFENRFKSLFKRLSEDAIISSATVPVRFAIPESKSADGEPSTSSKDRIRKKIHDNPNGTVTIAQAAEYFDVAPKTIRAWINGDVSSRYLKSGAKRGTVTNESILRLEKTT